MHMVYFFPLLKRQFIDMRKSTPKDIGKITMQPTGKKIEPDELEFH